MLFFDIGANVGDWAKANGPLCDKIISVEPDPDTFKKLVSRNLPKVTAINYAICNNDGKDIVFNVCTSANTISTLNADWLTNPKSRFYKSPFRTITCKTMTLETMIDTYGMPDLLKIDVEAGEFLVISSLKRKVPLLCFEFASEMNDISNQCLDHLQGLGFSEFSVQLQDSYTYRPTEYTTIENVKAALAKMPPRTDWGMIWCR